MTLSRSDSFCMCEDSQYLINSPECEETDKHEGLKVTSDLTNNPSFSRCLNDPDQIIDKPSSSSDSSVMMNTRRANAEHSSAECKTAVRRSKRINGKGQSVQIIKLVNTYYTNCAFCTEVDNDNQPTGRPKGLKTVSSVDEPSVKGNNAQNMRNCTEPKSKRRKYVYDTVSGECATMTTAQNRESVQLSPSLASTITVSVSKGSKMHTAESQTTEPEMRDKIMNSTERVKVFKKPTLKNIHKRNFMGETQLHRAAGRGDLSLVTALIEAGSDINESDNAGWTAIHEACCRGFSDVVLALLEMGANVNNRGPDGIFPIHDAVCGNHLKTVQLLLDYGADPYARDDNHKNAFDKCCDDEMAQLLKSHCQSIRITNKNCMAEPQVMQENSINSTPVHGTKGREQSCVEYMTALREMEGKQNALLEANLCTPEDAEKYMEEMRHIQGVLNYIVMQHKSERDELLKKYRTTATRPRFCLMGILQIVLEKSTEMWFLG